MSITSERIRARREELGLSLDDLAAILGKNRTTIYRYETGFIEQLPIGVIPPLAKALNVSPSWLMGWTDDMHVNYDIIPSRRDEYTVEERKLVESYRDRKDMQTAVKRLLGLEK